MPFLLLSLFIIIFLIGVVLAISLSVVIPPPPENLNATENVTIQPGKILFLNSNSKIISLSINSSPEIYFILANNSIPLTNDELASLSNSGYSFNSVTDATSLRVTTRNLINNGDGKIILVKSYSINVISLELLTTGDEIDIGIFVTYQNNQNQKLKISTA